MDKSSYFEGILQLRNGDEHVLAFAVEQIGKNKKANIAKVTPVASGYDIYMAPQRLMRSLGNKLQQVFGGQLTVSKKLHTRNPQTSRDVYRINVLLKLPSVKKGDIIEYKGSLLKIIGIHRKILAKDIDTGKKVTLNISDVC